MGYINSCDVLMSVKRTSHTVSFEENIWAVLRERALKKHQSVSRYLEDLVRKQLRLD